MDEIMTNMNQLAAGELNQKIQGIQDLAGQNMAALAAAVVIGLILCFFGLKLIRVLAAAAGLCVGIAIGVPAAQLIGLEGIAFGAVMLACGVIVAILVCRFYRVGIFLWAFMIGSVMGAVFLKPESIVVSVICLAIGLAVAVITAVFLEPLVIIVSSANGGLTAGTAIAALTGFIDNPLVLYGISLALAIIGMIVQFMMRSREVGKKERQYSEEFKAKASRETEVEKARMLLKDNDDEEDDDPDDDIKFVE